MHLLLDADIKIITLEEFATTPSVVTRIDLALLLPVGESRTTLMINLEEQKDRYRSTVEELKKVSVTDFVHLFMS